MTYDILFVSGKNKKNTSDISDVALFNLSHIQPILNEMKSRRYSVGVNPHPKKPVPAKLYVYSNCIAVSDFPWMKDHGKLCYQGHGGGLFKDYAWARNQHLSHDVLMMIGNGFVDKYEKQFPSKLKEKTYRVTGYAKLDNYVNRLQDPTTKEKLVEKWNLNKDKPIVVYAPTWGQQVKDYQFLSKIENIIFAARKGSPIPPGVRTIYDYDKSLELMGADVIISDISSLATEVCRVGKKVIQVATHTYKFTHMKHPEDLTLPEFPDRGPYVMGQLVTKKEPYQDIGFWKEKIIETIESPIPEKAQEWAKYAIQYSDNQNAIRCADLLSEVLNE